MHSCTLYSTHTYCSPTHTLYVCNLYLYTYCSTVHIHTYVPTACNPYFCIYVCMWPLSVSHHTQPRDARTYAHTCMHARTHTRYIFQYLFSEVVTGASQESCWIVVSCSERVGALGDGSHTQDGDHVDHTVRCVLVEYCKLLQQILVSPVALFSRAVDLQLSRDLLRL